MKKLSFSDLIGKTILIELTYHTANHELIERKQYWGSDRGSGFLGNLNRQPSRIGSARTSS